MQIEQSEASKILQSAPVNANKALADLEANKYETESRPPQSAFTIQSKADSSLYEAYQLRPYNPADLYQKKDNYDIFDEMREDEVINPLLTLKKFLIVGDRWEIECEDDNIKEFLEWNLYDFLRVPLQKKIINILSGIDYGFSLTEKIFELTETPNFGQKIVLKDLLTRPPHSFEFDQDDFGIVTRIRQDSSMTHDIVLDPKKFIHYIYQYEFDNPYGRSDLNIGVYKCWWSKNAIQKFWNIFLERFGSPTVIGKYPMNLKKERDNLTKALKNIQAKTSIVIPDEFSAELMQASASGGGQSGFEQAIDKYNTLIARKMLIPDLLGYSGGEIEGGSFALGQEQFNMFYNNIDCETKSAQDLLTKEILNPLVLWNFGTGKSARFVSGKTDASKKQSDMKLWIEAVKTGKIPVVDRHVNWFLQGVDAPEIDDKEFEEIQAEKDKIAEGFQNSNNKPEEDGDEKEDSKKEEKPVPPKEEEKENTKKYSQYFREFTVYEKKVDFVFIERETKKIEDKYIEILGSAYKLSINALVNDISQKKIIERKRIDQVNKLQLKHRPQIRKIYRDLLTESYNLATNTPLKKFAIIQPNDGLNDDDIALWIKEQAFYTETEEAQNILKLVKPGLMDGIRKGNGTRDTVKILEEALQGYDIATSKDIAAAKKAGRKLKINRGQRIETITRTISSKAYNESRKQEFQEIGDEIQAYQFSAILDGRTTKICQQLDKKIFGPEDLSYYTPPIHFNCRSLIVPIFNDEKLDKINKVGTGKEDIPSTEMRAGGFLQLTEDIKEKEVKV